LTEKIKCPNCGLEIDPNWEYCVFCGEPIKETTTMKKEEPPTPSEFKTLIKEILMERAEFETINKELEEILRQIDAVKHVLELNVTEKSKVLKQISYLKNRLRTLKEQKQKLTHHEESILLEQLIKQKEELAAKLDELNKMKKTMDKVVYKEMKKELETQYEKVEKDLKEEVKEAKKTLKDFNKELIDLKRNYERLVASYKLGNIDESEYNVRKTELSFKISKMELAIKILQDMIEKAD